MKPPIRTDYKQIETMLHTTNTSVYIFDVEITNINSDFTMNMEFSKVDRAELISMPNPHYKDIIQTYTHLEGVQTENNDNKEYLPGHVILEASEYANIKTKRDIKVEHQSLSIPPLDGSSLQRQEEKQQLSYVNQKC